MKPADIKQAILSLGPQGASELVAKAITQARREGAEDMRERAAHLTETAEYEGEKQRDHFYKGWYEAKQDDARAIRNLPLVSDD